MDKGAAVMVHQTFLNLPEEKRARIFVSAVDEFVRLPYERTSINRIVENAGIPKGSFYQYFDSKDDLYTYCILSVYRQVAQLRQQKHQPLLAMGLKRAAELGIHETIPIFNAEVGALIGAKNHQLLLGLTDMPRRLRNDVLLEVATELIMPSIREELANDESVPPGTDLDFLAYLLSLGELISFDYGSLHGNDDLNTLTYRYMDAIYRAFTNPED